MSGPRISFIVSAFNRPGRLRTCLAAIADQTYPEWEAIVVDNSDNAIHRWGHFSIAFTLNRRRIRHVDTSKRVPNPSLLSPTVKHTRCLYTAAEIGAGMASGEWLAFPNDDTAYPPLFAERMIWFAEHNNFDLVYCNFILGGAEMDYRFVEANPWNCSCDKTAFIMKKSWFEGFPHKEDKYDIADGLLLESLVARGIRHGRLAQCLIVHN